MTVTEAAISARIDALVSRVINNPDERCTDRDIAFHVIVLRRWVRRVGLNGPLEQFTTQRGDQTLAWEITRRGEQVAREELERETAT